MKTVEKIFLFPQTNTNHNTEFSFANCSWTLLFSQILVVYAAQWQSFFTGRRSEGAQAIRSSQSS